MIGHYLLTLTEQEENRLLERPFRPVAHLSVREMNECGCMVLVASAHSQLACGVHAEEAERGFVGKGWRSPGYIYEYACVRFGAPRVNAAIRNRILSNRARRILTSARALGSVGAVPGRP